MNVNNIISKQKSYEIIKSRDGTFLNELVKNSFIVCLLCPQLQSEQAVNDIGEMQL